jgi:hypothetical protein
MIVPFDVGDNIIGRKVTGMWLIEGMPPPKQFTLWL